MPLVLPGSDKFQAMSRAPREPDQDAFVRFAVLVAALSCLALLAR
jgi:hypothetical protein